MNLNNECREEILKVSNTSPTPLISECQSQTESKEGNLQIRSSQAVTPTPQSSVKTPTMMTQISLTPKWQTVNEKTISQALLLKLVNQR